jgi:6-phosphogluconolactonase (cycloisomerase 2 family)
VATGGNNSQLIAVDPTSHYAYVSNVSSNSVAQFSIDRATGALTPLSPATISMGPGPGIYYPWSIAVHPSGKWVYVSIGQRGSVNQYAIGSDGTLSPINPPSVAAGGYPDTIALDPSGQHAYVSDGRENDVYQYTIDQGSGALSPMNPPTVPAGGSRGYENAWFVRVDPTGRFAYVTNYFDGTVSQYVINETSGALSPMTPATVPTGSKYAEAIAFDPSGKHAYVTIVGATSATAIAQFSIDQTNGTLSLMSPPAVAAGGAGAAFLTVDAAGLYAYATSGDTGWGSTTVAQYEVGPDGALTLMSTPTVPTGFSPWGVTTIRK